MTGKTPPNTMDDKKIDLMGALVFFGVVIVIGLLFTILTLVWG